MCGAGVVRWQGWTSLSNYQQARWGISPDNSFNLCEGTCCMDNWLALFDMGICTGILDKMSSSLMSIDGEPDIVH